MDLKEHAIKYAEQGFYVIPLLKGEKKPSIAQWPLKASDDLGIVRQWWDENPSANIGLQTRGLVVVDIDIRNGGSLSDLEKQYGTLPDTPICITGRGDGSQHYYFRLPDDLTSPKTNFQLMAGVDIKAGNGSLVVAPPSVHPESGLSYEWDVLYNPEDVAIAEVPEWLLELVTPKTQYVGYMDPVRIPEGQRNDYFKRLVARMRAQGVDSEIILETLRGVNAKQCDPPEADSRLVEFAKWGERLASVVTNDSAGRELDPQGIGEWVADRMRPKYRYDSANKQWYEYTGNHWKQASPATENIGTHAALEEIRACLDSDRAKIVRGYSNNTFTLRIMTERAKAKLETSYESFLHNPWLLNLANGVLDLKERSFRLCTYNDLFLGYAPVAYEPSATCPTWVAFLKRSLTGDASDTSEEGKETLAYLQKLCGLILVGEQLDKVAMFVYGEKHTGKSTFLYTLDRLLGKHYAIATDMDTFKEGTYGNSRDSRKARLAAKRYVFVDETSVKEKIDTAGFKKITAGHGAEEIARKLYGQPFNYPIEYMLVIGTNELPRLDTNDPALWDRVCPVLFSQSIPFEERDGRLPEKLDAEQSGILNWMLQGLYAYMEDGKQIREIMPQALQELKEKLRLEFAPVESFVKSQLTFKDDAFESIARLDTAFERWCELNDIDTKYIKKYALSKFLSKKHKLEKDKRRIEAHHNPVWGFVGVKFDGVIEEGRYYPSDF